MLKQISIFTVALVILFESLLPKGMGISQAARMGELYTHYQLHKGGGMSLSKFLWMHYSSDSSHKSKSEHKKLPSFESQLNFLAFELNKVYVLITSSKIALLDLAQNHFDYSNLYHFQYKGSLLNPPRIAA